MSRSRAIVAAGLAAGLLANYWVLEGVLAERSDPSGSWISDLGARSEDTALPFDLLDGLAGLAIVLLALLLWRPLADRARRLRLGLVALLAVGLCGVVDAAFPLSCAETLQPGCELDYDAVDVVHATENVIAVLATAAALWLLGTGMRAEPDLARVGAVTLALAAAWLLLTILMGSQFLIPAMDDVKGLFQLLSQLVLGAWLIAMAIGIRRLRAGSGPSSRSSRSPSPRAAGPRPGAG
jgi:Protein of unknown function (DUF998)